MCISPAPAARSWDLTDHLRDRRSSSPSCRSSLPTGSAALGQLLLRLGRFFRVSSAPVRPSDIEFLGRRRGSRCGRRSFLMRLADRSAPGSGGSGRHRPWLPARRERLGRRHLAGLFWIVSPSFRSRHRRSRVLLRGLAPVTEVRAGSSMCAHGENKPTVSTRQRPPRNPASVLQAAARNRLASGAYQNGVFEKYKPTLTQRLPDDVIDAQSQPPPPPARRLRPLCRPPHEHRTPANASPSPLAIFARTLPQKADLPRDARRRVRVPHGPAPRPAGTGRRRRPR